MDESKNHSGHGYAVMAGLQTQGRGTNTRAWSSIEGNLLVTFAMHPDKLGLEGLAHWRPLELLCGYVLSQVATQELSCLPNPPLLEFRPRNDLFVINPALDDNDSKKARKLAGVLVEPLQSDWRQGVAVGMGLNITSCPDDASMMEQVTYKKGYFATSLTAQGVVTDPELGDRFRLLREFCELFPIELAAMQVGGVAAIWQKMGLMDDAGNTVFAPRSGQADPIAGRFTGYDGDGDFRLSGHAASLRTADWRPVALRYWESLGFSILR